MSKHRFAKGQRVHTIHGDNGRILRRDGRMWLVENDTGGHVVYCEEDIHPLKAALAKAKGE